MKSLKKIDHELVDKLFAVAKAKIRYSYSGRLKSAIVAGLYSNATCHIYLDCAAPESSDVAVLLKSCVPEVENILDAFSTRKNGEGDLLITSFDDADDENLIKAFNEVIIKHKWNKKLLGVIND